MGGRGPGLRRMQGGQFASRPYRSPRTAKYAKAVANNKG